MHPLPASSVNVLNDGMGRSANGGGDNDPAPVSGIVMSENKRGGRSGPRMEGRLARFDDGRGDPLGERRCFCGGHEADSVTLVGFEQHEETGAREPGEGRISENISAARARVARPDDASSPGSQHKSFEGG